MSDRGVSLCRSGPGCGACCWGHGLPREALARRLHRQREVFRRLVPRGRRPTRLRLLLVELVARRGRDLAVGAALWLPWVGDALRARLAARALCAFAALERGASGWRPVCQLHPTRWGRELRPAAAFALLEGVGCGEPGFVCDAARAHATGDRRVVAHGDDDWFERSVRVARLHR